MYMFYVYALFQSEKKNLIILEDGEQPVLLSVLMSIVGASYGERDGTKNGFDFIKEKPIMNIKFRFEPYCGVIDRFFL